MNSLNNFAVHDSSHKCLSNEVQGLPTLPEDLEIVAAAADFSSLLSLVSLTLLCGTLRRQLGHSGVTRDPILSFSWTNKGTVHEVLMLWR